ncbi:MAG: hypothetical protein ACREAA_10080 [Candidatus Polarisedimenticolia bacterium]
MRRLACRVLVPAMFVSAAVAQDLDSLRREFHARQYGAVLQPLIDYRLKIGNQTGWQAEEVDYMVTTTFCSLESHRQDGCRYAVLLKPTLRIGPEGRKSTADLFSECCKQAGMLPPCAPGVGGKADEVSARPACARVDGKTDDPAARSGPTRQDILREARARASR